MAKDILTQLQWRYATKKFDSSKKLPVQKIDLLKEAFNLTATSYGLQPLKMLVISNEKLKEELVPLTMNQAQVKDASHVLVLCTEKHISKTFIENYFANVKKVRNTPDEILAPFQSYLIETLGEKDTDTIDQWTAKQAYLALGNLLTVCALEEIDACPIEGFDPNAYDSHLALESKGLKSVLVLAVGYRATDDMFSAMAKVRRGVQDVVIELD